MSRVVKRRRKGQLSQTLRSVWLYVSVKSLPSERLQVLGELLGGQEFAARGLGDLPQQGAVGGRVFQLAVVLVDDEPGAVAADLLAVAGRDDA